MMHRSPSKSGSKKDRKSLDAFEKLFEKAFSPRDTPTVSPLVLPAEVQWLQRPMAPEPPPTPLTPGMQPYPQVTPQETSMDPVWSEVRQAKEHGVAVSPGKVLSAQLATKHAQPGMRKVAQRSSHATFKESEDGRTVIATFDVPGVKKQDMHVSFRSKFLVVSWRTVRVSERKEGEILVREREESKHSQVIPLAEGTQFNDVRASRDGRHLILTYPNARRTRVDPHPAKSALSGTTEFYSCLPDDVGHE